MNPESIPPRNRDHDYFNRRHKTCVKCNERENMPSSSYCAQCHKAYNTERQQRLKSYKHVESDIVNQIIEGAVHVD